MPKTSSFLVPTLQSPPRPLHTAYLLVVAALMLSMLGGCDCSGPSGACESQSDCADGMLCVDGICAATTDAGMGDGGQAADTGIVAQVDGGLCAEDCGQGACIDGACCSVAQSCSELCCGDGQICSFDRCVDIGDSCAGSEDCDQGAYCELQLGVEGETCGGVTARTGRCLARPPSCPDGMLPDPENPECVAACSFTPDTSSFEAELTYRWGMFDGDRAAPNVNDVRNSPIVINLDDDDCDGRITARDIPEIVVIASPDDVNRPDGTNAVGDLVALSVVEGELREKYRVSGTMHPHTYPAGGNFDGSPGNEIAGCSVDRHHVLAYTVGSTAGAFTLLWESVDLGGAFCSRINLADLDQDGDVEVITGAMVLDGATGMMEHSYDSPNVGRLILTDIDQDDAHTLEIVTSSRIYSLIDGTLTRIATFPDGGSFTIAVNLDGVGGPELVTIHFTRHDLSVWRYDASATDGVEHIRNRIDINGDLDPTECAETSAGRNRGGGPPTAGDVNMDGIPDIAVAGGVGYAVLDGRSLMDTGITDPSELFFWHQRTVDCSSAQTGSSVFDFNGDGRAEVLYADEHTFRIYEGNTGNVLFSSCSTNGTIQEQPIVADVDNDGQADIVVVSNARYRFCLEDNSESISGVSVFGSVAGDWVRTRRVWNQHSYHITNVEEDGSIPRVERRHWADPELNSFRLNRQPGNQFAATDAVAVLEPRCMGEFGLTATVTNLGEALLPRGARVAIYRGMPPTTGAPDSADLLGEATTTRDLYPAQSEVFEFNLEASVARSIVLDGTEDAFAVVDPADGVIECRPNNNAGLLTRRCTLL